MSHETIRNSPEYALQDFEGTYIGFMPTDESDVGVGELEAAITDRGIATRHATGLELQEEFIPADEIRELSAEEIKTDLFEEGATIPAGVRAFDVSGLHWVFFSTTAESESAQLMIVGGMGDILGPTALFGPSQIEHGMHEHVFRLIEAELGEAGSLPRLSAGGVAQQT